MAGFEPREPNSKYASINALAYPVPRVIQKWASRAILSLATPPPLKGRTMRRWLPVVVALIVSACGGKSPTEPQGPSYPTVSGSYAGTITIAYPELQTSVACPATTSVAQTGASVSVAPIVLGGACAGYSIPFGSETIDQNGSFGNLNNYTYNDPSCGVYSVSGSGGFFGRQLQFSITAVSSTCWNFSFTATLSR